MEGDPELEAMTSISDILSQLPSDVAARVLRWAVDRFQVDVHVEAGADKKSPSATSNFMDLADLFTSTSPSTEAEKVLVAAYWLQQIQGAEDLESQQANSELKNLGHGISNITRAFDRLIAQRPQLAIQTRKTGTSKQSRKRYRITTEGIRTVEAMIHRGEAGRVDV